METNPNYWDCECLDDYIHLKIFTWCNKCGAFKEDCPDSRVDEVEQYLKERDLL